MGQHTLTYRVKDLKDKKKRYREDPEFRARLLLAAKERYKQLKRNKIYRKIRRLDKRIYNRRQSIEVYLKRIASLERSLIYCIEVRDRLREQRKSGL